VGLPLCECGSCGGFVMGRGVLRNLKEGRTDDDDIERDVVYIKV
jgi:hypothetical protein